MEWKKLSLTRNIWQPVILLYLSMTGDLIPLCIYLQRGLICWINACDCLSIYLFNTIILENNEKRSWNSLSVNTFHLSSLVFCGLTRVCIHNTWMSFYVVCELSCHYILIYLNIQIWWTALFVISSSVEYSWKRTKELLVEVARQGEVSGHGVPCLLIAAKDDLDPCRITVQDSAMVQNYLWYFDHLRYKYKHLWMIVLTAIASHW